MRGTGGEEGEVAGEGRLPPKVCAVRYMDGKLAGNGDPSHFCESLLSVPLTFS